MPPRQGQVKGVHHQQALIILNVKGTYLRNRKRSKTMNSKMTMNSQLPTTEPEKRKTTKTKTKQQEQNQKNGHHMKGFWGARGMGGIWGKGTGNKKHS